MTVSTLVDITKNHTVILLPNSAEIATFDR